MTERITVWLPVIVNIYLLEVCEFYMAVCIVRSCLLVLTHGTLLVPSTLESEGLGNYR